MFSVHVVQHAMRHTSPETKRHYQLGITQQVRQAMEKSNKKAYDEADYYIFATVARTRSRKE
jgi:hypothetical protein